MPIAHPYDDGSAVLLHQSAEEKAAGSGPNREANRQAPKPLVEDGTSHPGSIGAPGGQRPPPAVARFASHAIRSATRFTCCHVHGDEARSLFGGNAAQSLLAFDAPLTAGFGLFLNDLGNAIGWPITLGNERELVRNLILGAASSTVTFRVLAPNSG